MTDLTTLADVKEWISLGERPQGPRDDAMLARLITSASDFIETWMSRPIVPANWQEIRDGMGGERANVMQFSVLPVTAVLLVMVDGIVIPPAPPMSQQGWTAGYRFSPTALSLWGYRFSRGVQNVLLQYTAGRDHVLAGIDRKSVV